MKTEIKLSIGVTPLLHLGLVKARKLPFFKVKKLVPTHPNIIENID